MHLLLPILAAALTLLVAVPTLAATNEIPRFAPQPLFAVEDAYPHVRNDGRVVFQSNRAGGTKLFVAQLDGTQLRQITSGPSEDATPKWSPDGRRIAFASTREANEDIWIINADGSGERNLTQHAARRQPSELVAGWQTDRVLFDARRR